MLRNKLFALFFTLAPFFASSAMAHNSSEKLVTEAIRLQLHLYFQNKRDVLTLQQFVTEQVANHPEFIQQMTNQAAAMALSDQRTFRKILFWHMKDWKAEVEGTIAFKDLLKLVSTNEVGYLCEVSQVLKDIQKGGLDPLIHSNPHGRQLTVKKLTLVYLAKAIDKDFSLQKNLGIAYPVTIKNQELAALLASSPLFDSATSTFTFVNSGFVWGGNFTSRETFRGTDASGFVQFVLGSNVKRLVAKMLELYWKETLAPEQLSADDKEVQLPWMKEFKMDALKDELTPIAAITAENPLMRGDLVVGQGFVAVVLAAEPNGLYRAMVCTRRSDGIEGIIIDQFQFDDAKNWVLRAKPENVPAPVVAASPETESAPVLEKEAETESAPVDPDHVA